jgi:uncharacterized protein YkwD
MGRTAAMKANPSWGGRTARGVALPARRPSHRRESQMLPRHILVAVLSGLVLATVAPFASAPARAGTCYRWSDAEKGFVHKTNAARANAGAHMLRRDPELSRVASKHAHEMAAANVLYHTPSNTLTRRVTRWRVLGENVGKGSGVRSLQRAFMNSPVHRRNILYPGYRYIGVGVVKKNGRMWVTVIFEGYDNPGTRLTMPPC